MTTGKTIALIRWTFVDKVIPLVFNSLSRLLITFVPRSKLLLISWLQSPSAVILVPSAPKTPSAVFVVRSSIYLQDSDPSPPLFPTDIRCLQELV